jgi:hypothetical protein
MRRLGLAGALFALLALAGEPAASAAPQDTCSGAVPSHGSGVEGDLTGDVTPDADEGFLTVTTDPPAKLEIDGVDTGKTTPVTKLALAAGKHKVTLTTLDGKTKRTLGVTIVAGEEKRLTVTL